MKQLETYKKIRKTWEIDSNTRIVPNKKKYNRKRDKQNLRKEILDEI